MTSQSQLQKSNTHLKNLQNRKVPGKDGLKLSDFINVLKELFAIDRRHLENWNQHTKYKSDDPTHFGNYRGITLKSALGNIFYQILNNKTMHYIENNSLLVKEQSRFRKKSRTSEHIFILKKIFDQATTAKSGRLYSCFDDLQNAFDKVRHARSPFAKTTQNRNERKLPPNYPSYV